MLLDDHDTAAFLDQLDSLGLSTWYKQRGPKSQILDRLHRQCGSKTRSPRNHWRCHRTEFKLSYTIDTRVFGFIGRDDCQLITSPLRPLQDMLGPFIGSRYSRLLAPSDQYKRRVKGTSYLVKIPDTLPVALVGAGRCGWFFSVYLFPSHRATKTLPATGFLVCIDGPFQRLSGCHELI